MPSLKLRKFLMRGSDINMNTSAKDEDLSENQEEYWRRLFLLADAGENLVKNKGDTLQALSLQTIFKFAIHYADVKVLQSCLMLGVDVNAEILPGYTPLLLCIESDKRETIKTLIDYGVDVNQKSKHADSPLHYAVENGKANAADALLAYAKNSLLVNSLGNDGLAPLHRAAKYNMKEMIRVLASHGADVNVRGEGGSTPLHVAASCSDCGSKEQSSISV